MKIITCLLLLLLLKNFHCRAQITGCTDPLATNYDALATQNDGSCTYATTTILPITSAPLPDEMVETSALLYYENQLVTLNDDTHSSLYQFSFQTPQTFSTVQLPFSNVDWEALTQDENYIYVGDFGNNSSGNRTDLKIYRVPKNSLYTSPEVDTIAFSYATQTDFSAQATNTTNFDCEAFIATSDKLYLFTKEWGSKQTSIFEIEKTPGTHLAQYKTTWNCQGLITDATYYSNKNTVVLCGYTTLMQPFIVLLYDYTDNDFFSGNKRKINLNLPYHQVEGITTENGLNFFVTNEKLVQGPINNPAKIHQLDLSSYLNPFYNTIEQQKNPIASSLVVYPNPVASMLHFQLANIGMKYTVRFYDVSGRLIDQTTVDEQHTTYELNHQLFSKGSYKAVFSTENSSEKFSTSFLVE